MRVGSREWLARARREIADNPHPAPTACLNPRCDVVVQTCELGECSIPGHEKGCQVEGGWVCSEKCWDIVTAEDPKP